MSLIHIRHDHYHHSGDFIQESLNLIIKNQSKIMATQAELAQQLRDITSQNEKSRTEILQKLADLEAALAAAGGTTPEVDDALRVLKESIQADDDIVPDVTPEP
jgi:thymidine phosphorylase